MTDNFPCPRKHFQYGVSPSQEALIDFGIPNMLIYGHNPTPPPPATLTQEQLARDAGQLVEAHALLDKLCDDTDRSQHSLVHRLKQILLGSEEMNKILEKAGFNTAAGLLVCVQGLAKQRVGFAERLDEADKRNFGYLLEIERLKGRNKRLHEAQGNGQDPALDRMVQEAHRLMHRAGVSPLSGTIVERVGNLVDECARLKISADPLYGDRVRAAHRKLNTVEQVSAFGTIDERVTSLVDLFKVVNAERNRLAADVTAEAHRHLDSAAIPSGSIAERVAALVRRCEHHASHYQAAVRDVGDLSNQLAAAKSVPLEDVQCHLKLNEIVEIERTGSLLERVSQVVERLKLYQPIIDNCRTYLAQACQTLGVANTEGMTTEGMAKQISEELARSPRITLARIPSIKLVDECFRLLDKAGIPNGTLCERVRVAIERGQQPKPKPDYLVRPAPDAFGMWEVVDPNDKVRCVCATLADAQRICASLRAR